MSEPFDRPSDERTLAALARALPRVAPPDDMFMRIVAATARTGSDPVAPAAPRRLSLSRFGYTAAAAVLAAAAASLITLYVQSGNSLGRPAESAPIAAHLASTHVAGQAVLYSPATSRGMIRLRLRNVPVAPRGSHYEVWVLRRDATEMTAVGSFTPATPTVSLALPLPGAGQYVAVDISIQKDDGPADHSNISLAGARF